MGRFGSVFPALNVEDAVWVGDFNVHMLLPSLSFSFWPTVPWALLACSAALLWRLPLGRAAVGIQGLIWCEMAFHISRARPALPTMAAARAPLLFEAAQRRGLVRR